VRVARDRIGVFVGVAAMLIGVALYPLAGWLDRDAPLFISLIPVALGGLGGLARLLDAFIRGGFLTLDPDRGVIVNHDREISFAEVKNPCVAEQSNEMTNTELRTEEVRGYGLQINRERVLLSGAGLSYKKLEWLAETLDEMVTEWRARQEQQGAATSESGRQPPAVS
jgi:hypothetical protein